MRKNRNTLSWLNVNNNDVTIRNVYLHKAVCHPTSSISISTLLPPFQIVDHFGKFRYIICVMYLDIAYI